MEEVRKHWWNETFLKLLTACIMHNAARDSQILCHKMYLHFKSSYTELQRFTEVYIYYTGKLL
jgi:hypothetical protein